ncbi:zeta toxin family protein [Novipirellula sp. SH528]|uniref:zeta toxin family protein n=1 Tax=Novipirellula sp. SH528 TaxID=3454466 RepID=UPI003F9F5729
MLDLHFLDTRPIVIALAGSNGAGKSTFFAAHLADSGLRFVNADEIAGQLAIGPYEAAEAAAAIRVALVERGESFVFETVLSDPIGEKVEVLAQYAESGYEVVMIFIRIAEVATSIERVSIRASQGGHDVPDEKLQARFARTQANLERAIQRLPHVLIFENSDLSRPYRLVERYRRGERVEESSRD